MWGDQEDARMGKSPQIVVQIRDNRNSDLRAGDGEEVWMRGDLVLGLLMDYM